MSGDRKSLGQKEKMDNQLDVFGGNNQQVFRTLLQNSGKKKKNQDKDIEEMKK